MCLLTQEQTDLSYINDAIEKMHTYWEEKVSIEAIELPKIEDKKVIILFMSIGNPDIRARVHHVVAESWHKAMKQLKEKAIHFVRKNHVSPQWIKLDLVTDIQELTFTELEKQIKHTRKNYFRSGISFDQDFRLAFLEQEINGNAMIRSVNKGPLHLNEKNINHYLNKTMPSKVLPFIKARYLDKQVYTFQTEAVFLNRDEKKIIELYNGKLTNGIRKVQDMRKEVTSLIHDSTYFLQEQMQENGQFEYGYFSAFAKRINTYNILRHSSTLYAMGEGYEQIRDASILTTIERGIDYAIREAMVYQDQAETTAFMVDHANHQEIKLGSNATAILAMTKYMEITNSSKYLKEAQALAKGIVKMKTVSGGFIHVLSHPDFEIKALHRIIYYEGEAVFSLLRLYALDKDDKWLEAAKDSMDYFIENEYWKHHDHWLSYAANEITEYVPEDKYFVFGLKNCHNRLDFIYHRDTTYPTFLELTMAAYKLVGKVKQLNKDYLLEHLDETQLNETIDKRAEYQRVGYFYPEMAMYMKYPRLILNGFFIRHHSFRVRIDDVEHYLSGYCQYLQHRIPDVKEPLQLVDI